MTDAVNLHPASYRDPSGFIFKKNKIVYRQVNKNFKDHFDHFISSGCYENLVKKKLLIPHDTINENMTGSEDWYSTLKPEPLNFISYPYEWSFDLLKDAALLTLQIMKESIQYEMILKDATPYNIQWHNGKLIFIDTLSFEKFNEEPWIAYRQFCENFLGPLLVMHYSKSPLHELMLGYPDGIPLTIIKSLLPKRSKFALNVYLHIFLQERFSSKKITPIDKKLKFSKQTLLNLIASLENLITKLRLSNKASTWSEYYDEAGKRENYLEHKKNIIENWISESKEIKTGIDLGANNGEFSKLVAAKGIQTIAADFDPYCINDLYKEIKQNALENIQPLIIDLSNPSPSIGVNNEERVSFFERANADIVLALALIHHLAIGKNIPFEKIADMFSRIGERLIVEFIPKEDEKVQLMLQTKKDIFDNYNEEQFLKAFETKFRLLKRKNINQSGRTLFLFNRIG